MKKQDNKQFWFKLGIGILVTIGWIILIFLKINDSEVSLLIPFIITIIITIGFFVYLFFKSISKYLIKPKEKKDETLEQDKIEEILHEQVKNMWNNIIDSKERKPYNVGNDLIYCYKVELEFKERFGNSCYILINATSKKIYPAILPSNISDSDLRKAINNMSSNPNKEPDVEETETSDPFGKTFRTKKIIHNKKEEKEKEEEVV